MHPLLRNIVYNKSAHDIVQCLPDTGSEVAFAGRSNVGKSSAINSITNRRNLARTSKTPGRTQQIIFFDLDQQHRLVDLPGYGYAKVPRKLQHHWEVTIELFLVNRACLKGLFLPMDIRHPLKALDQQMLEWCNFRQLPVHILLTKSDKLKQGAAKSTFLKVGQQLQTYPQVSLQLFSAVDKSGVDLARKKLLAWLIDPEE